MYFELQLIVSPEFAEILIAELAEIGFESFTEESDGINGYILESQWNELLFQEIIERYQEVAQLSYKIKIIEKQNWNAEWEQNYPPIEIAGACRVRASFHPENKNFTYEIVINPKMSFGTGHHETTSLMLEHQLELDHQHKQVLDVGSGTGILAIMAAKRGATQVQAFDIEEWATENARENVELNDCPQVSVRQGTIEDEPFAEYDIVLANINRNILLREIPTYATFLQEKATLLLSGFYEQDLTDIEHVAMQQGLQKVSVKKKNNWIAARFDKL